MRMQEFGSEGGVGGRVFGAAELRRPMGYLAGVAPPQYAQSPPPPPPPQIKCPRCESTNTKFCYYNNYNLSQPRHFCKSCRRYWTKGGVLRNVPVGGGCRKSKRAPSKPPSSSSSSASKPSSSSPSASAAAAASDKDHRLRLPSSSSRSSSDSSTLTAAADHPSRSNPSPNPFETLPQVPRIFPEPSGTFASMMSPGSGVLDLGFSHPAPLQSQQQPKSAAHDAIGAQQGFADQTVGMDLTPPFHGRSNGGGLTLNGLTLNGLDWPGTVDPTLYDLSGAVDHWNPSHWGDTDPSLYLP